METIIKNLLHQFGETQAKYIIKSPGRINLIGEHTDYNLGFALTAAIDQSIYCAIAKNSSLNTYEAHALDKKETLIATFENQKLYPSGAWQNFVIGVVQEILKTGKQLSGFKIMFTGNIPQGAGLSSSAALENAIVFALNKLFDLGFSKEEMILISQKAEHHFVGVQCGIMDQLSSMFGKENKLLKIDFLDNSFEEVSCNLNDYELLLINSNVQHELSSSEYNTRRKECKSAFQKIQEKYSEIHSFQEVNNQMLASCKPKLSEVEYKRITYLIEENERVLQLAELLQNGNLNKVPSILLDAHIGMKNLYEITCPETDFLVEKAMKNPLQMGARQMGGGFGGCTINLIKKGTKELFYTEKLQQEYFTKFGKELSIIPIEISRGTYIVWSK